VYGPVLLKIKEALSVMFPARAPPVPSDRAPLEIVVAPL